MSASNQLLERDQSKLKRIDYPSLADFKKAIDSHPVWFAMPKATDAFDENSELANRLCRHHFGAAACLTLDDARPADYTELGRHVSAAFIPYGRSDTKTPPIGQIEKQLSRAGFRLFYPHLYSWRNTSFRVRRAYVSSIEFLVSKPERLENYPEIIHSNVNRGFGSGLRAVFMLELIQDIEILKPLILRAAMPDSPFKVTVSISQRVLLSVHGPRVTNMLDGLNVAWASLENPSEINSLLGFEKALLITASESNMPGHDFVHHAVRAAPPRTLRITMQHGYECVGLRHHPVHDVDKGKKGVRFASDLILTWQSIDRLPNLHPMESHKIIPVGFCKAFAETSTAMHDDLFRKIACRSSHPSSGLENPERKKMLIAENLHSPRISSIPARYHRFLQFILDAQSSSQVDLTVRSHPGKRTLEKQKKKNHFTFLEGELTPDKFIDFDLFVSPPSTIILDSILAGAPTLVWSDGAHQGDIGNYAGLEVVTDFEDMNNLNDGQSISSQQLNCFSWLAENTSAFNGVPNAWNVLTNLTL